MKKIDMKKLTTIAAIAATFSAGNVNANENPFGMQKLTTGYNVAMSDGANDEAEDGGDKATEAKCGEGKCGGDKAKEAKCGEGKCGGDKAKEAKCGGDKAKEAKCGSGG